MADRSGATCWEQLTALADQNTAALEVIRDAQKALDREPTKRVKVETVRGLLDRIAGTLERDLRGG